MSLLATIGLINEHEEGLVDAFVMTDEISLLLLQEGIDPSTVNRLHIPSGMSKVGTFTILCYLPAKWGIDDTEEIWARVGPIKWKLSRNYRIKRIFPNSIHENGTINTLCVVSFDDWRYELNLANSGTSQKRIQMSMKQIGVRKQELKKMTLLVLVQKKMALLLLN